MTGTGAGGPSRGSATGRRAGGSAPVGYFWGEDAFGLEQAARAWASGLEAAVSQPFEVWRAGTEAESESAAEGSAARRKRLLDEIEERLATATLFGAGTLVVLRQPGLLLRETGARARALAMPGLVSAGNALAVVDLVASGARAPAAGGALRDAVEQAGGRVEHIPALSRERMESWLERRSTELGVKLGSGAAHALAERVGAWVREADVDRRRQSELANAELEKLALYRPGGTVTREDVAELVVEAIPGSAWAFLDAIGYRRAADASRLAERLLDGGSPLPVLIAQLHRRLGELIVVRDHLAAGTKPAELPRLLKLQPFRAQKLTEQARMWEQPQLDGALSGLLGLDLLSKGIAPDGSLRSLSDSRSRLALLAWIAERVSRSASSLGA